MKDNELKDKIKVFIKYTVRTLFFFHIGLALLFMGFGLYLRKNHFSITTIMLYREKVFTHNIKPIEFIPLDEIPDAVVKSVIFAEDSNFYSHHGIDFGALILSYFANRRLGYRFYGGSTITQQLSRTLFLIPKRTLVRKYFEVIIAVSLETVLPKDRILELYLNSCEWGKGVFGIGQASEYYFGKPASRLSLDEYTRLVTILPSPLKYSPYTFENNSFLNNRYIYSKFRHYTFEKFHGENN
jgi:membrane peptidoglycan carboxypeptidase